MSSTTLTIGQLCLSPFNVRRTTPTPDDTVAIEASILIEGLRVPIDCHAMRGSRTKFGTFAGRRRYFAIKRLVERGDLAADWPVPVVLHDGLSDAELIEMSITENLLRKEMNAHELCAGVAMAAAKGHDVPQIARNLGQHDLREVGQWLRLGRLAKPVFTAFAEGRIEIDQARAYAATEDRDLQEATFARFATSYPVGGRPSEIRRAMNFGDAQARRHLSFVGETLYRAAGGGYELDLFAGVEEDRGRIVDLGILEKLVEEKVSAIRDQVRETTQRRELRFIPTPPQTQYHSVDHSLAVTPVRSGDRLKLPDGDVVAHIDIDAGGEATVSYWWASRKAKFGSGPALKTSRSVPAAPIGNAIGDQYHARQQADAALKDEAGLTADATQVFRSLRKTVLRGALLQDAETGGDAAVDLLVWSQLRMLVLQDRAGQIGMSRIVVENQVGIGSALDSIRQHIAATPASRRLGEALTELQAQTFMTSADLAEAFLDYRASAQGIKRRAAAIVAGLALERSLNADGYRCLVHDAVATEAHAADDAELRQQWSPTYELLALLPKAQRLAIAEEVVPEAVRRTWPKLKSSDLTHALLRALPADWVHPLLHFDASAGRAVAVVEQNDAVAA